MTLKKTDFSDDEIAIYEEAVIYKRGDYWQMRMWLQKEKKYARFSLRTRNRDTAIDKAKKQYHELMTMELSGRSYFSLTTKQGVELYLEQRQKDVAAGIIVSGRHKTIATHLQHWLKFIGKDTKLKELSRTDCENYFHERHQTKKRTEVKISQSTIVNEQSTINAMMSWLFRKNEAQIDAFDFKKLKAIDTGDLALKRPVFTKEELASIDHILRLYVKEPADDKNDKNNATKAICGHFLAMSMLTGMRRGELLQLKWKNISAQNSQYEVRVRTGKRIEGLFHITVPGAISKVRRTRQFMYTDEWFMFDLLYAAAKRINFPSLPAKQPQGFLHANFQKLQKELGNDLIFSIDGETQITPRAIYVHFENVLERADIADVIERGIVPYSFRHSFITHKVNSGLDMVSVAEMCGTSVAQIEKTYYRTTLEKMKANALSDYNVVNGSIVRSQ
jgi:integrase